MSYLTYRNVGLGAAVIAAAALAIALGSERWGGLVPCPLCLLERWPYRIVVLLGLVAAFLPATPARVVLGLLALTLLSDAVLSAVHVGVEYHWWASPLPECAAPKFSGGSIAERLASMPAVPSKPCDEPAYFTPALPVSIATMNLFFAAGFAAAVFWVAIRRPDDAIAAR